ECLKSGRVKRPPGAVDKARYAIFLSLRNMVAKSVQLLEPERVRLGLFGIEQARAHHGVDRHTAEGGEMDAGIRIERLDDACDEIALAGLDVIGLVDDDDVGELDLLDQKVDQRARVALARRLAA